MVVGPAGRRRRRRSPCTRPTGACAARSPWTGAGCAEVVWAADSSALRAHRLQPDRARLAAGVDAATGAVEHRSSTARDSCPTGLAVVLVEPTPHRVPTPGRRAGPVLRLPPAPTPSPRWPVPPSCSSTADPRVPRAGSSTPSCRRWPAAGSPCWCPNVRGSTGYGKRWYSLDDVDLRLDSVADLAALHAWLPELGLDPERSALWGGSYGGYMVLAGVDDAAGPVGGRRRHRRHLLPGHLPGEHLRLPAGLPRARVRHAGARSRPAGRGLARSPTWTSSELRCS